MTGPRVRYLPSGDRVGPTLAQKHEAILAARSRHAPSRKSPRPTALERVLAVERMVEDLSQDLHALGEDIVSVAAELRALTTSVAGIEADVFKLRDRRP
jgi:hypothetical protein